MKTLTALAIAALLLAGCNAAPLSGSTDCGPIQATLDAIGTEYETVDTPLGPGCVEEGTFLYVDATCAEVQEAGGPEVLVGAPMMVFGCQE